MGEARIFATQARVELIDGEIIQMAPIGSPHAGRVNRLTQLLVRRFGTRAIVQIQNPVVLGKLSQPEPDVAVLRPRADFYSTRHPTAADVWLIIEVADTSRDFDRTVKAPLYARSGIPELWIVDIVDEAVEVHRQPRRGLYRDVQRLRGGQRIAIAAFPKLSFRVTDILG